MSKPKCPGLEGAPEASDIVWRERTCGTCSHVIRELEGQGDGLFMNVVAGCDRGLQNSSYPCDAYEREPGVD